MMVVVNGKKTKKRVVGIRGRKRLTAGGENIRST